MDRIVKNDKIVQVATDLKKLILEAKIGFPASAESLEQIIPFVDKALSDPLFTPQRLRFDHLFIESELANNKELADLYSKFANLYEGLEA
ncbi:hypothetical protein SAMN02745866_03187 [Alteromonadaceae bacterium Bs31]|nr:hypothetical protein SAMN02745866_03187 [Alteromonadaceae bacterium Bs31]